MIENLKYNRGEIVRTRIPSQGKRQDRHKLFSYLVDLLAISGCGW